MFLQFLASDSIDSVSEAPRPRAGKEVSLEQLAATGMPIAWYEALAIVQQICSALTDESLHPLVEPSRVFVRPSGDITVQSSGSSDADISVRSLGELLRNWLTDSVYPVPLRLVVAQATSTPPFYRSIAELSEALSHYERANRQELVRKVYEQYWQGEAARSVGDSQDAAPADSTAFLRQKLHALYQSVAALAWSAWEFLRAGGMVLMRIIRERWRQRRRRRAIEAVKNNLPDSGVTQWNARVSVLAVALMLLAVIGSLVAARSGVSATTSSNALVAAITRAADRAADALVPKLTAALNWLGTLSPNLPDPPDASVHARPAPPKVRPRPAARTATDRSARAPAAPAALPGSESGAAVQPVGLPTAAPPLPVVDNVVYSAANADVTPPTAIDQQLLDAPPSADRAQSLTAIDLVIDEAGRVQSATLAKKPASLQDAMHATIDLSAAKTWQFHPALKDGRPVKYRKTFWLPKR